MKKFILRFILISGSFIGIAYLKKDQLLDALIQHSIDVNEIDASVDNLIKKTNITFDKMREARLEINNSRSVLRDFKNNFQEYSNKIQPTINNLKQHIQKK